MRKLIFFIAFLSTFIFSQTPNGTRKAWTDTLKISRGGQFVDIMEVIADSGSAADGVTIINDGTFKQKVFADISTLNAASADTLFTKAWLRGLNASTNPNRGSGDVVYADSTTLRSLYGAGIDLTGISYKSSTAGKRWYRLDALSKEEPMQATWFGVVADGATDDTDELNAAEAAARALGRNLALPDGSMRLSSTWLITGASQNEGMKIFGQGEMKTILLPDSGVGVGVQVGDGLTRARNVILEDLSIHGTGQTTSTDTALFSNITGNNGIYNVQIGGNASYGFKLGAYVFRADHLNIENLDILYCQDGLDVSTNVNGCNIESVDIGQMSNEFAVRFSGGSNGNYISGEFGSVKRGIVNVASRTVLGPSNFESIDSACVRLEGGEVLAQGVRFLGSLTPWVAEVTGTDAILTFLNCLESAFTGDTTVIVTDATSQVYNLTPKRVANGVRNQFRVINTAMSNLEYNPSVFLTYNVGSGSISSTNYDENRGKPFFQLGDATTEQDRFLLPIQTDSGYVAVNMVEIIARLYGSNTLAPGIARNGVYEYSGDKVTTFSGTVDSTVVTITVDASGVGEFLYIAPPNVESTGGRVFVDSSYVESNASAGTFTYVIFHKNRNAPSAQNANVYYRAIVKD